jgi:hypothetical protein
VDHARLPDSSDLPDELVPIVRRQAIELSPDGWSYDLSRLTATLDLGIATPIGDRC